VKQKTFVIRDETVLSRLIAFINAQDCLVECVVREHRKQRLVIQNSLYWFWCGFIGNELGLTKEDVHFDLKRRLLVPIYIRDDTQYNEMVQAVRHVHKLGAKTQAKLLEKEIVRLTSTTQANTKQFAEYLTEIERDMAGKGIVLPRKEDQYYDALMIKP
jgi:hypothetical protein